MAKRQTASAKPAKATKEEVLRHRVLAKIYEKGGCFLDNAGQFLRACRLSDLDLVQQTARARRSKTDANGNQMTEFQQWFKLTEAGKVELARLEALGCKAS